MGAQSSFNSLTGAIIGSIGTAADIDKKMSMKARNTLKNKLSARKELRNQATQRIEKIGGKK